LSRRDADRVERALAVDHELARRYDLVREELAETVHLNESLGAPSARAMEKLFAAIDAEEARMPRRQRSFDLGARVSQFLNGIAPRTLAWSAAAAVLAILVQAAVITTVMLKDPDTTGSIDLASAPSEGSFAVVRFAPQATASEITNFLGAHKATLIDGPLKSGSSLYRLRLADEKLPAAEVNKIIRQMQEESRVVGFVAVAQ
jgi:hypothetical protein